jgi:hypothetical protein
VQELSRSSGASNFLGNEGLPVENCPKDLGAYTGPVVLDEEGEGSLSSAVHG